MKTVFLSLATFCAALLTVEPLRAEAVHSPDISFRNEVQHAIDKGLDWLQSNQNTNGYWSTADQPAVTALALSAFMGEPSRSYQLHPPTALQRGFDFIAAHAKSDGSIYGKGLQNYNTSICMMALVAARNPQFDPILRRARQWVISQQVDGGVGYGDHGPHSDMNNTYTALEALYYSKYLDDNKAMAGSKELNWGAAIHFIQSCQNPADDSRDKGGFVYYPGDSKAGSITNAEGRVALRSYGSISYAGLLSYIYADLQRDDPRVQAAFSWVSNNFTLDENPGMGPQGLYYYFHLMSKALTIYGVDQLKTAQGQTIDWRKDLAMKLINLQKTDGSWVNGNGRWWEHDPSLVTSYSLMSLEILYPGL
jgi:squalene-hopene/tetraprenyl-beta-curcumene cyclase